MFFRKRIMLMIIFLWITVLTCAQAGQEHSFLTPEEIQRVSAIKALLMGVDEKSVRETVKELAKTQHPRVNLEMKEAMARAYTDIVKEFKVDRLEKKKWLYSMVCLNMAYLQFGGDKGTPGSTSSLNMLIRQKLKEYLPPDVLKQPGFLYSL